MTLTQDVVTLLRAALPDDVKVYAGRVTDASTPARFVIVTPGDGQRIKETYRAAADYRESRVRLTVTAVLPPTATGSVVDRAEWLVDRCEQALTPTLDHELTRFMGSDETLTSLQSAYFVADFTRDTL